MRIPLIERLKGTVIVADGAWGTTFQRMGLKPGESPDLWNLTYPQKVFEVANGYVQAGAEIIKTNSFGSNRFCLANYQSEDKVYAIARLGAEISRKAAGEVHYVMGSIGPSGKMLCMQEVSSDELYIGFKEQAQGLIDGGADALLFETYSDIEELRIVISSARELCDLPIIASCTFQRTGENTFHTMMGASVADFYDEMIKLNVAVIGTNCGTGFQDMVPIVRTLRSLDSAIPLLVLANAGIPILQGTELVYPDTPDTIQTSITELLELRVNIIGGCCGAAFEHIRMIRDICSV